MGASDTLSVVVRLAPADLDFSQNADPMANATVMRTVVERPSSSTKVHAMLRGSGRWAAMPDLREIDEETAVGSPSYSVLTGDYETGAQWESVPIEVGRELATPTPVFTKLDPSVVDEELARLSAE